MPNAGKEMAMNWLDPLENQRRLQRVVEEKLKRARVVANAGFNLAPVAGAIIMTAMIVSFVSGHPFLALTILVVAIILSVVTGV